MKHTPRNDHSNTSSNSLNALHSIFSSMSSMLGLFALIVCLSGSAYLVYLAAPALQAIPKDLAPNAAIAAMLAIDGMVFAPILAGLGIALWWNSRPE